MKSNENRLQTKIPTSTVLATLTHAPCGALVDINYTLA